MLAIGLCFIAGRYHATPWGRHVNEADVEWPPSPWRIVRALAATWHRKLDHAAWPEPLLESLLSRLAEELPQYRLPVGVHAHLRHFMPARQGKKDRNTLVFDAFLRLSRRDELVVCWPELQLGGRERELLDLLVASLGYLGRAESWVEARRLESWQGTVDCLPDETPLDQETGEMGELVPLFCPLVPDEYLALRSRLLAGNAGRKKKIRITLPESWLAAISMESGDLQAAGWSGPPAGRLVLYRRPAGSLRSVAPVVVRTSTTGQSGATTIRFALYGRPLPRMEDAIRIGEVTRAACMHLAQKRLGEVPPLLSGHGQGSGHGHAFFLPEADSRGKISHLLLHVPAGLDTDGLAAVQGLSRLYDRRGHEWQVLCEGWGQVADFADLSPYAATDRIWRSVTPYLRPWHCKKRFGTVEQVRRECRLRGLPDPEDVVLLREIHLGGRPRRPVHFHRFRNRRGLIQPDSGGSLLRIVFPCPVQGPLALGFGCHFGLGLMVPEAATGEP